MKLFCPDCGRPIPADDAHLESGTAKCPACDSVFSFREALYAEGERRQPPGKTPALTTRPPRFRVEDAGGQWTVRWRWFTPGAIFLAFFCIAWDSFLIFWYRMAFREDLPWLMVVFPIAHVAVGVGLTYAVLSSFLNSTTLRVAGGSLTVRDGPLPWFHNCCLAAADLERIYLETARDRGCNDSLSTKQVLTAMLRTGRKIRLAANFSDPDEPRYLLQELQRRLRLAAG
jgi:hypothetical protein